MSFKIAFKVFLNDEEFYNDFYFKNLLSLLQFSSTNYSGFLVLITQFLVLNNNYLSDSQPFGVVISF